MNTLDWPKLHDFVRERRPVSVDAGLLEDWFWTAAEVYRDGAFVEEHGAYLLSHWATAGFKATMANGDIVEVVASCEAPQEVLDQYKRRGEESRKALAEYVSKCSLNQSEAA